MNHQRSLVLWTVSSFERSEHRSFVWNSTSFPAPPAWVCGVCNRKGLSVQAPKRDQDYPLCLSLLFLTVLPLTREEHQLDVSQRGSYLLYWHLESKKRVLGWGGGTSLCWGRGHGKAIQFLQEGHRGSGRGHGRMTSFRF